MSLERDQNLVWQCRRGDQTEENSIVLGNISSGIGNINREPGAVVKGNIVQGAGRDQLRGNKFRGFGDHPVVRESYPGHVVRSFLNLLGLAAVIIVIMSVFPLNMAKIFGSLKLQPARVILVGVLGWLALPFVAIVSLITIIGPVVLLLIALLAVLVGTAVVSATLGEKLRDLLKWQTNNQILTTLAGLGVLWLAALLPLASIFIIIFCSVTGMGLLLVTKFGTGRPWFPPRRVDNYPVISPPGEEKDDAKGGVDDDIKNN